MNHQNFDAQIQKDYNDAGLDTELPSSLAATVLALTAIHKEIQTCAAESDTI
jgi:hypothetical protein